MKRVAFLVVLLLGLLAAGCGEEGSSAPAGNKGVLNAKAESTAAATVERRHVAKRLVEDNKPGAVKHLYLISPYSGQVILYSTVDGKVTSSQKRLTPREVGCTDAEYTNRENQGIRTRLPDGYVYNSPEVVGDDGTYGDSYAYLFWWDTKGRYHQIVPGNCVVLITDKPLVTNKVTIDLRNIKD